MTYKYRMAVSDHTIIGPWITLHGGYGEDFAIHGNMIAGAQANRLNVWSENKLVNEIWLPRQGSGFPRWVDSKIYWCDGWHDTETGKFTCIKNILTAFESYGAGIDGYAPFIYSWSPDGEFLIVSLTWIGENETKPSLVIRINKNGTESYILWKDNDFAPRSAHVSNQWIVLGTRQPSVYQPDGKFICRLKGTLIPERIASDEAEKLLMIHSNDGIRIWETRTWTIVKEIDGYWLDAALSPDGKLIMLVDFNGNLFSLLLSDSSQDLNKLMIPDPVATISIGKNLVVAAFSKGDPVRMASLINQPGSV